MMSDIGHYFQQYLKTESLFKDKSVLQSNYLPNIIPHREEQIQQLAKIVAPGLRRERPSNIFIYGKTGTGKTLTVRHTLHTMQEVAKTQHIPLRVCYINCKLKRIADTEYRLIAELAKHFGKPLPPTGLPTDEIYNAFYKAIDKEQQIIIIILDEIDQLVKKIGDEILYNLTRINTDLKQAQVAIIGISNDLIFSNTLDPRVKSSLSEEELVFPPYNASQLQHILTERATAAFREGTLDEGVVAKCAAYAAREHGDARRALELLRVAGEVAERNENKIITMDHIDAAEEHIEKDKILEVIETQTKQFHATLHAILALAAKRKNIFTGDVYEIYRAVCSAAGLRPLTQRRVSDIIAEMDMLGIINAKVISKGRFGRMREITIGLPESVLPQIQPIIHRELGLGEHESMSVSAAIAQEKISAFVPEPTTTTQTTTPNTITNIISPNTVINTATTNTLAIVAETPTSEEINIETTNNTTQEMPSTEEILITIPDANEQNNTK